MFDNVKLDLDITASVLSAHDPSIDQKFGQKE